MIVSHAERFQLPSLYISPVPEILRREKIKCQGSRNADTENMNKYHADMQRGWAAQVLRL